MKSRFIILVGALVTSSLALGGCASDNNDGKVRVEPGKVYSLDVTSGTVNVTVNYDSFWEPSEAMDDGYLFTYDDGSEKGNVIKLSTHSLDEYENFDEFVTELSPKLVTEGTTNVFQQGPISHGDTPGYAWVYESDSAPGIGHVAQTLPAGPQDALLIFGTASGDLNRLEEVIDTFDIKYQEN